MPVTHDPLDGGSTAQTRHSRAGPLNRGVGGKRHPERQGEIVLNSILTRGSSRKLAYPKVDRPFTPIPASAVLQAYQNAPIVRLAPQPLYENRNTCAPTFGSE